jgi:hypothetical protein
MAVGPWTTQIYILQKDAIQHLDVLSDFSVSNRPWTCQKQAMGVSKSVLPLARMCTTVSFSGGLKSENYVGHKIYPTRIHGLVVGPERRNSAQIWL